MRSIWNKKHVFWDVSLILCFVHILCKSENIHVWLKRHDQIWLWKCKMLNAETFCRNGMVNFAMLYCSKLFLGQSSKHFHTFSRPRFLKFETSRESMNLVKLFYKKITILGWVAKTMECSRDGDIVLAGSYNTHSWFPGSLKTKGQFGRCIRASANPVLLVCVPW